MRTYLCVPLALVCVEILHHAPVPIIRKLPVYYVFCYILRKRRPFNEKTATVCSLVFLLCLASSIVIHTTTLRLEKSNSFHGFPLFLTLPSHYKNCIHFLPVCLTLASPSKIFRRRIYKICTFLSFHYEIKQWKLHAFVKLLWR